MGAVPAPPQRRDRPSKGPWARPATADGRQARQHMNRVRDGFSCRHRSSQPTGCRDRPCFAVPGVRARSRAWSGPSRGLVHPRGDAHGAMPCPTTTDRIRHVPRQTCRAGRAWPVLGSPRGGQRRPPSRRGGNEKRGRTPVRADSKGCFSGEGAGNPDRASPDRGGGEGNDTTARRTADRGCRARNRLYGRRPQGDRANPGGPARSIVSKRPRLHAMFEQLGRPRGRRPRNAGKGSREEQTHDEL